jgi:hypothetical protein
MMMPLIWNGVCTQLGLKWPLNLTDQATPGMTHLLEDMIRRKPELPMANLNLRVPVTQVVTHLRKSREIFNHHGR